MDKKLSILGYSVIGIGILGSLVVAAVGEFYPFNWCVFIFGALGSCIGGGIIIGLAEIIERLDRVYEATNQQSKQMETGIKDILNYQQGTLDAVIEFTDKQV